eukprot:11157576-Lingulodinium_polyedra.AAC.1
MVAHAHCHGANQPEVVIIGPNSVTWSLTMTKEVASDMPGVAKANAHAHCQGANQQEVVVIGPIHDNDVRIHHT